VARPRRIFTVFRFLTALQNVSYHRLSQCVNPHLDVFSGALILRVSVAPPGLAHILLRFPGGPFGPPGQAYKPDQHLTVAPSEGNFLGKPLANFCTAIPTHNIAVGWADFEGPCCHPERPPAPDGNTALKELKAGPNRS